MLFSSRRNFFKLSGAAVAALQLGGCGKSVAPVRLYGGFRDYGNQFGVACMDQNGEVIWRFNTPARVHEVCLHENLSIGAVVARRPGYFIQLFEPLSGKSSYQFSVPEGLIYEGHALIRQSTMGTTELWASASDLQTSASVLLKYDLAAPELEPERIFLSGLGPHQMSLIDSGEMVIAIGGWKSVGREVFNADAYQSGLVYLQPETGEYQWFESPVKNISARHFDVEGENLWLGMQLADPVPTPEPMLYRFNRNSGWLAAQPPERGWQRFSGYVASVAINQNEIFATSPQGQVYGRWTDQGEHLQTVDVLDISAATSIAGNWWLSSGTGEVLRSGGDFASAVFWDNHWVGHPA